MSVIFVLFFYSFPLEHLMIGQYGADWESVQPILGYVIYPYGSNNAMKYKA